MLQYADDTLLFYSHTDIDCAVWFLQRDAVTIMDWFKNNQIKVNASKTKLACFRNPWKRIKNFPPVFLHKSCACCCFKPLEYVHLVKYLGIYLDSDLSWDTHPSFVSKRLKNVSCQLLNHKFFCTSYMP